MRRTQICEEPPGDSEGAAQDLYSPDTRLFVCGSKFKEVVQDSVLLNSFDFRDRMKPAHHGSEKLDVSAT